MKTTMVIPTYWARETKVGWKKGDAIFDHPTPLDQEEILLRAIQSIKILNDKDFQLVIIAAAISPDIEPKVEEKVKGIIKSADVDVEILLFSHSHLRQIHQLFSSKDKEKYISLLQMHGYSNIRNLCVFLPHILSSEIAVLIDDDEVFEDPAFMGKAKEFIGKRFHGRAVDGVAGYYLQPDGEYRLKKEFLPWMAYWEQLEAMNRAFDEVIATPPRLKETPFAFGGNMIIHQDLFRVVPFDPNVPRGEDIDYLMNARMFGFYFFLDSELSIKHLPPPKTHPTWRRLRVDIFRFLFEKAKIDTQRPIPNMDMVVPEDFDPYPGCFLKSDLEDKIYRSNLMLALDYLSKGDKLGCEEALNNISLAKTFVKDHPDPFGDLLSLQRSWQEMMEYTAQREILSKIRKIVKRGQR